MSFNLNRVHIAGRLVADPIARAYEGGSVTTWTLAINKKLKDGKEDSVFVDVSAFGRTAEVVMQFLKKGGGVYVEGRLQLDKWQTKEGEARQRLKVIADHCQFTDGKPAETHSDPGLAPQVPAPAAANANDEPPF